ncbi:MAG: IPT/TIG domain-containing protein [Candidatus Eremiobacteraeota bacterium]|nr:IPT/TIG domain-containing protein [Candidatus Eremiobacteraeota bacterium]
MKKRKITGLIWMAMVFIILVTGCGGTGGVGILGQDGNQSQSELVFTSTPPTPPPAIPLESKQDEEITGKWPFPDTTLPAGWNTVSFPFDSLSSVSGFTYYLYKYDPVRNSLDDYVLIDPIDTNEIDCTKGYWAYSNAQSNIFAEGTYTESITSVTLDRGWNFFGFPLKDEAQFSNMSMTYNGVTRSLANATSFNTTSPVNEWAYARIYYYVGNTWHQLKCNVETNWLEPWRGYWIWSWLDGVTLNFVGVPPTLPPSVDAIEPSSGNEGDKVTISGFGFGNAQGASTVTFSGVSAGTASTWTNTKIVCTVPTGAKSGPVVVTVYGEESNKDVTFIVTGTASSGWELLNAGNYKGARNEFAVCHSNPNLKDDPLVNLGYFLTTSLLDLKDWVYSMQDEWEDVRSRANDITRSALSPDYSMPDIITPVMKSITGEYLSRASSQNVTDAMEDLEVLKDKLTEMINILDKAAATNYQQIITPQGIQALIDGYEFDSPPQAPEESFYFINQYASCLKAMVLACRAQLNTILATNLEFGDFNDWGIDPDEGDGYFKIWEHEGFPPAPFGTLKAGGVGARLMSDAGDDIDACCDAIISAINETLNEHDPNVETWDETIEDVLNEAKDYANDLKAALQRPQVVTLEVNGEEQQIKIDLSRFYYNPVNDILSVMAGWDYTNQQTAWGPAQTLVGGKPTYNGIFPDGFESEEPITGAKPRWNWLKVITTADSGTYEVWAGTMSYCDEGQFYLDIGSWGYDYMGTATDTHTFNGQYDYYVIACPDYHNPVYVDAIEGNVSGPYQYLHIISGCAYTQDPGNAIGSPDGESAKIGTSAVFGGYPYDGYIVVTNPGVWNSVHYWNSIKVWVTGSNPYHVWGGNTSYLEHDAYLHYLNIDQSGYYYTNLGSYSSTHTFNDVGQYDYFVIVCPDEHDKPVKVDAVQGSGNTYLDLAANIEDWFNARNSEDDQDISNMTGQEDGQPTTIGYWDYTTWDITYDGFVLIRNGYANNPFRH